MRRAGHEAFHKMLRNVEFNPIHTKETVLLTDGLLSDGSSWDGELRR